MPIYVYKHPTEERYEEIIQTMSEPHIFSKDGVEWKRVFLPTRCSISANADPFNSNSFVEKTANMKGTFGDMMDYSKLVKYFINDIMFSSAIFPHIVKG